jgi:hypothetical protein
VKRDVTPQIIQFHLKFCSTSLETEVKSVWNKLISLLCLSSSPEDLGTQPSKDALCSQKICCKGSFIFKFKTFTARKTNENVSPSLSFKELYVLPESQPHSLQYTSHINTVSLCGLQLN